VAEAEHEALLSAARGGNGDALDALLRQYQPRLYRFGMKMCGDREDAREVLQETLFAAARTLPSFRGAASISTWLYTIARSFCIKKRRRSVFAPELVSLESEAAGAQAARDEAHDPERRLADMELGEALEAAIAALQPEDREVLLLRDMEGLPATDVAEVTGRSVAAVKSRLHRARLSVRARLAPFLPGGRRRPTAGSCPATVLDVLSRHLEGEIGPEACAEMERHVKACARCEAGCASLRETLRLCSSAPAPEVPAPLQEAIRQGIRAFLDARQ
jgi:RNA polymerase sigma-70 factor (ECF subfamily)